MHIHFQIKITGSPLKMKKNRNEYFIEEVDAEIHLHWKKVVKRRRHDFDYQVKPLAVVGFPKDTEKATEVHNFAHLSTAKSYLLMRTGIAKHDC